MTTELIEKEARIIVSIALDAQAGSAADAIPLVEDYSDSPAALRAVEILEDMAAAE